MKPVCGAQSCFARWIIKKWSVTGLDVYVALPVHLWGCVVSILMDAVHLLSAFIKAPLGTFQSLMLSEDLQP